MQDLAPRPARWFLLCRPLLIWEIRGLGVRVWRGRGRRADLRGGRRAAESGRLPLPYLPRHVALAVAAAGRGDEDEDDEPPLSKRILREGGGGGEGKTRSLCPSPQGESTLKGKSARKPPRAPPLPARPRAWQRSPCTCSPVCPFWVVGGGTGCRGGWVGRDGGQGGGGGAAGLRPRRLCAGAAAATAGRGRQHGGVSGGVGAAQQQGRP